MRSLLTANRSIHPTFLVIVIPVGIYLYPLLQFGFGIAAGAILRLISPQKDIFVSEVSGFGKDK